MMLSDGNDITKIYWSLIYGECRWKKKTDGKNKQICNNKKVNKVQQSKNGRINQDLKTKLEGDRTNQSRKEIKQFEHGWLKKDKKKYCFIRQIKHGSLEYDVKYF